MQVRKGAAPGGKPIKRRARVDSESESGSEGENALHGSPGKDQASNGKGKHKAHGNGDMISDDTVGMYHLLA
jgi:hypothetical protein